MRIIFTSEKLRNTRLSSGFASTHVMSVFVTVADKLR